MDLSLFYFAADADEPSDERYRLLLEGARFADENRFTAVWTPERHFHRFGGNYPNPALTAAALATVTKHVSLRAGSVVAPLHHILEVAENWAMVDNLSHGRVGVSLAPGGSKTDLVLRPNEQGQPWRAPDAVDQLRRLWRGGSLVPADGPKVFPSPVQPDLPLWLTSGGNPETFRTAGRCGTGVLTHLAGQTLDELSVKIAGYRSAFELSGAPGNGHVVLMLHCYLGRSRAEVEAEAAGPLERYLVSAFDLFRPAAGVDAHDRSTSGDRARLAVRPALNRYLRGGDGLFGTVDDVSPQLETYCRAGVDEIACLIDFGIPTDRVLDGLEHLAALRVRAARLRSIETTGA